MEIHRGIDVLTIRTPEKGQIRPVYLTLVHHGKKALLIDAGFPGQGTEIIKQIQDAGFDFTQVGQVILTHQDIDHIGSINELKKLGDLEILAYTDEIKYIEGRVLPHKLAKFDNYGDDIPADLQSTFERLKQGFSKSYTDVHTPLYDGQELDFGLTVIHTSGHTDGHICLYHKSSKTLITADLFLIEEGRLKLPNRELNVSCTQLQASLDRLKDFNIKQVVTYHDGGFTGNVKKEIERLQSI
ncbi:MAG: MBL fold metallo-hydrolase [Turicibacter sp.]|nr:MBL fold metallo-hydrolase [Turicibacter sp.]